MGWMIRPPVGKLVSGCKTLVAPIGQLPVTSGQYNAGIDRLGSS